MGPGRTAGQDLGSLRSGSDILCACNCSSRCKAAGNESNRAAIRGAAARARDRASRCTAARPAQAGSAAQQRGHMLQLAQPAGPAPQPHRSPPSAERSLVQDLMQPLPLPVQAKQLVQTLHFAKTCTLPSEEKTAQLFDLDKHNLPSHNQQT